MPFGNYPRVSYAVYERLSPRHHWENAFHEVNRERARKLARMIERQHATDVGTVPTYETTIRLVVGTHGEFPDRLKELPRRFLVGEETST